MMVELDREVCFDVAADLTALAGMRKRVGAFVLDIGGGPKGGGGPLPPAEIEKKFPPAYHPRHVDTIFARVFGT